MNSLDVKKPEEDHGAPGILSISIRDLAVLQSAYMPFLENGGLFIPTNREYVLNDEVFIFLSLMDEAEKIPLPARVVWITPRHAQGNRAPGIGVQFREKNNEAVRKIEEYLAGQTLTGKNTHTL